MASPSPPPPSLPVGWSAHLSPEEQVFYYHHASATSHWHSPFQLCAEDAVPPYAASLRCPVLKLRKRSPAAAPPQPQLPQYRHPQTISPTRSRELPPPVFSPDVLHVMQACSLPAHAAELLLQRHGNKVDEAIMYHVEQPHAAAAAHSPASRLPDHFSVQTGAFADSAVPAVSTACRVAAGRSKILQAIAADMGFGDISNIIHEECGAKMGRPDIKRALKLPEYAMEPARLLQDICSGQLSLAELERKDKKIVEDMLQEEKRSRDRIVAAKASGKGVAHVAAVLQQETRYKWSRALIMRALNEMSVYSTDGRHACGAVRLFEDIVQVKLAARRP
jgi:hypothetical protein